MGVGWLLVAAAVQTTGGGQDPERGITRELARARKAAIESVAYRLQFELAPGMEEVAGTASVEFSIRETGEPPAPVVLDFDGEALEEIRINGVLQETPPRRVEGHVVLPAALLSEGANSFAARFRSKVAAAGTPLSRYRDPSDGAEYVYTLLVPADAHRLFPCFDQPDLKASFDLELTMPADWRAVANGAQTTGEPFHDPDVGVGGRVSQRFTPTPPLSTYLFAFAAGPFQVVEDAIAGRIGDDRDRPLRAFVRASEVPRFDSAIVFEAHRRALAWNASYFDVPYPFGKLDVVLIPGFPYGGMEHAGAIFYRESALVFDHVPTESERIRRSTLIYHEVSHQWFGNLVTMEWFDDLWLKEGFATFVGFTLLEVLEPERHAWLRFHQRVKPEAYAVDATRGTTPVWQELRNLADAKSAYGPIVYNKAPAVLRELQMRLGPKAFQRGVRAFLAAHAFGNATWRDLVTALSTSSGASSELWSDRWILAPGMPRVRVDWEADETGALTRFTVLQEGVQESTEVWPLSTGILLVAEDGTHRTVAVRADGTRTELEELHGMPAPACALLNPDDVAYGLFLLDPKSRDWLVANVVGLEDPLLRAVALSALNNTLREGELDPAAWATLLENVLRTERDPATHAWLLDAAETVLSRYLPRGAAAERGNALAELLLAQLESGVPQLALQTVRFLVRSCPTERVLASVRALLGGELTYEGLELGRRDRFLLAAALLAAGDAVPLAAEKRRYAGADVGKEVYLAEAAAADVAVKERYFLSYQQSGEPPAPWVQDSLAWFHWPGQAELTLPFLPRALAKVEWVKDHRKIFFMPAWIDAFVNSHSSPAALEVVNGFLAKHPALPPDVRRKILQSVDGLERAVAIRKRWG
jgi:aminopeptidase N